MKDFGDSCPGCGACSQVCPFLAEYGTPDRILRERPEVSFYCTSCRRCDGICPQNLSPSEAFFEVKRRLVQQDAITSTVRKTLDRARKFAKTGHGFPFSYCQRADTVFWPGCGLAANHPGLVCKVRNILSRQLHRQVGLVLDCCYAPVHGLGDTETAFAALRETGKRLQGHGVRQVITGCLHCHKLLSEQIANIEFVFILEALPLEIFEKQQMGSISLHHPCPSSRWEMIRNKARVLVDNTHPSPGTNIKALPMTESATARCCGIGGNLNTLYPEMADRFLDQITGRGKNGTIVTYCIGCQNSLIKRGVEAIHLLEWLPGVKRRLTIPSPARKWINRFSLATIERLKKEKP
ncbi:MAG: heterodisulfide reductase-related iron-sulfur binding cluster [Syntrophales bacterium]